MKIGEFAAKAGVNIQTIRFYERQKLLPEAARTISGYRSYSHHDLERVMFIKRSQQLGFMLKEVKELMILHRSISTMAGGKGGKDSEKILDLANHKIAQINDKLSMLQSMKKQLVVMLKEIQASQDICPVSKKAARTK